MPLIHDPNLIVGLEKADDAGVYKLSEDLAIIQTIDFFTPIVDDPYTFGQIAVANALSDVYAMGGKPLTAMNVVCFPIKTLDISVLREILRGGLEKMREAGVVLVGGHSVDDTELKYGLSVTGVMHPSKVITKTGAKAGDKLILTKPLGTGIINTAIKGRVAGEETVTKVAGHMATLNKVASEAMQEIGVNACTDITGFGLLGHACEMIQDSEIGMKIRAASVPVFAEAIEFAQMGMIPGGTYRNKEFRSSMVKKATEVPEYVQDVLFDPQTSGGLFIAVSAAKADLLLSRLHKAGVVEARIVGEVVGQPKEMIIIEG
ncbi:MAG: selenide, water dikinase SelD [Chloroflexi bacterium RBG_13_53_26]|nr:MAG: selenide, water dikinase SelD [Chloroflexi bacterium RBG_13_53_26]